VECVHWYHGNYRWQDNCAYTVLLRTTINHKQGKSAEKLYNSSFTPVSFQGRNPADEPGADPKAKVAKSATFQPETSSAPENSMATQAGSLSGGPVQDTPTNNDQDGTEKKIKSKKCCVIL
jgi:hypothetical protein